MISREEVVALSSGEAPSEQDLAAYWDTTAGIGPKGVDDTIRDTGPHGLNMVGVNRPVRLMTGFNWVGADSFHMSPETYGGVHFHDDALTDSNWDVSHSLSLPGDLKSGVYALRLSAGEAEDHIPFIVRPDRPRARIAVLLPTFTISPTPMSICPMRRRSRRQLSRTRQSSPPKTSSSRNSMNSDCRPTTITPMARDVATLPGVVQSSRFARNTACRR